VGRNTNTAPAALRHLETGSRPDAEPHTSQLGAIGLVTGLDTPSPRAPDLQEHRGEAVSDVFLHLTNRGTHRLMFRLPAEVLDLSAAAGVEQYLLGDRSIAWTTHGHVLIDLFAGTTTVSTTRSGWAAPAY
jgi:hypothetical protein